MNCSRNELRFKRMQTEDNGIFISCNNLRDFHASTGRQRDKQTDRQTVKGTGDQLEGEQLQLLPVCVCLWPLGSCNMPALSAPIYGVLHFTICNMFTTPSPFPPLLLLAANASHCRILTVPGIKLPASVARMARHVGSRRTISIRMLQRVSMRHVPQVS